MSHLRMLLVVVTGLLAAATAQSLTKCTNNPNGYCVSMLYDTCKAGTYVSYSGCGFLEQCCYVPETHLPATTHNTPVASTCGVADYNSNDRIAGGTQTVIEKYPWQISLRFGGYHTCGGTIIADRWILTAAHCIVEQDPPIYVGNFSVIAGITDQLFPYDSNKYLAINVIVHPQYEYLVRNDLALIKVNRAIDLTTNKMKTICLADVGDDFTGQVCVATGWGAIAQGDNYYSQEYLREVDLPVVSHSICSYYEGFIDTNNICAGPRIGGKDTCSGDSGGPLICQTAQGIWKQAGIVSYGMGCANVNHFGVYTEVSKFRSWISDTMAKN